LIFLWRGRTSGARSGSRRQHERKNDLRSQGGLILVPSPHSYTPVANSNLGNGNLRPETFGKTRQELPLRIAGALLRPVLGETSN
jgi:hypothetical protein